MTTRRWWHAGAGVAVAAAMALSTGASSDAAPVGSVDRPASVRGLVVAARIAGEPIVCGRRNPVDLGYDPFYRQHCSALGLDVMGSAAVVPGAVERTAEIVVAMIGHRRDLIDEMIRQRTRVGVMATSEVTSDMPEYRGIYAQFPGTDWDTRARGLGATPTIPLSSVGEGNVVCNATDWYPGESIMVHEFAHTIRTMGLAFVDPATNARIDAAHRAAMAAGRWWNTYAATNSDEYFAEIVQSYFDTNIEGPAGGDGVHNRIDTRVELAGYDPVGFALVDELFADATALRLCNG